jgi:hypothetical protein
MNSTRFVTITNEVPRHILVLGKLLTLCSLSCVNMTGQNGRHVLNVR